MTIDERLLAKIPKKYHPVFEDLHYQYSPHFKHKHTYYFQLKAGYTLKYHFSYTNSISELLYILRNELIVIK